jgi:hypothetical protein
VCVCVVCQWDHVSFAKECGNTTLGKFPMENELKRVDDVIV